MTEPHPDAPAVPSVSERFLVRQKLTMMVNRYDVIRTDESGRELGLLCFAEQKRMRFKEEVTFFTDAKKTSPVFGFKARKVIDLGSGYDVVDPAGNPIGWFRKDFKASLLSSTWHLGTVDGAEFVGSERNKAVAVVRRAWGFVPVIGEIPVPFLFHFDFRAPDGSVVLSSTKKAAIKDVYRVELPAQPNGWRLDWRLGAAMAVALDALQSR